MTDDTPPADESNVVAFLPRRVAAVEVHNGQRIECHLCRHIAANEPLPLAVDICLAGRFLGIVARFEDDEEGRRLAQIAADAAIRTVAILHETPAPAGTPAA